MIEPMNFSLALSFGCYFFFFFFSFFASLSLSLTQQKFLLRVSEWVELSELSEVELLFFFFCVVMVDSVPHFTEIKLRDGQRVRWAQKKIYKQCEVLGGEVEKMWK